MNPLAGGVGPGWDEALGRAAEAAGVTLSVATLDGAGLEAAVAGLPPDMDAVLVLGGDGTARAIAEQLGPRGPPVAPLPCGTMNLLPHALYGVRPWPEVVAALFAGAAIAPLAGARADDRLFFVAGLFGAPALVARAREAVRRRRLREAWTRLRHAAGRSFGLPLRAAPTGLAVRRAEAVALVTPALTKEDGLEWIALAPKDVLEGARVGLQALFGPNWRRDPAASRVVSASGLIAAARPIPAILDGEPVTFGREVRIRYASHAANVLLPNEAS